MQLILNIESYKYVDNMSNAPYDESKSGEHGIVIKTHHPHNPPNLADDNTRIFSGTSNRISITKAGSERYLKMWFCILIDGKNHSQFNGQHASNIQPFTFQTHKGLN